MKDDEQAAWELAECEVLQERRQRAERLKAGKRARKTRVRRARRRERDGWKQVGWR